MAFSPCLSYFEVTMSSEDHKLKIDIKSVENSVRINIQFEGKYLDVSCSTTSDILLDKLCYARVETTGHESKEYLDDIESELYDSKLILQVHSATWDHNLISFVSTSRTFDEIEEKIRQAFDEECLRANSSNLHLLETRKQIFNDYSLNVLS